MMEDVLNMLRNQLLGGQQSPKQMQQFATGSGQQPRQQPSNFQSYIDSQLGGDQEDLQRQQTVQQMSAPDTGGQMPQQFNQLQQGTQAQQLPSMSLPPHHGFVGSLLKKQFMNGLKAGGVGGDSGAGVGGGSGIMGAASDAGSAVASGAGDALSSLMALFL